MSVLHPRYLGRALRERVLDDREAGAVLEELRAHLVELAHREAAIVGQDERVGGAQALCELRDDLLLLGSLHRITSFVTTRARLPGGHEQR